MDIVESRVGQTNVLAVSGALDTSSAPALTVQAMASCDTGIRGILIDLDQVSYLTSAAFRSFIAIGRRAGQARIEMALCGLNELLHDLFEASGLLASFRIYPTRASALEAIDPQGTV